MLAGCTPWPEHVAKRYRDLGYWQGVTLADLLARVIRGAPGKTALVHGCERISYRALGETVDRLASGFIGAGIRPLDRVVVQLPNIPEFVYTYFALARIGAVPVMALRAHRQTEVEHFLRASGAVAYVIPDVIKGFDYRLMAQELVPKAPALRTVFVVGKPAHGQCALSTLLATAGNEGIISVRVDPADVATMLLSGGTTSLSKLIPRTHDDYVLNARLCGAAAGFDQNTVLMAILPLGHNYNLASPGMLGAFYYGGTVVLATSGEAADVFGLVERERVTTIAAVVPLISTWLASDVPDRFDLSSIKVIQNGGARLAPELRSRLRERFGCTPQEIYGTAEGLINMTRLDDSEDSLLERSPTAFPANC
jgi:2,3-dihydroxybenzoate-AMP ligase